jgi:hypothetical protein
MRFHGRFVFLRPLLGLMLLGLTLVPPVWAARTVSIQAAVPLPDSSDAEFQRALHNAVETCVRGAVAMGMSWIRLQHAAIVEKQLIVEVIGSDDAESGPNGHDGDQGPNSHDEQRPDGHDGGQGPNGHDRERGGDSGAPPTLM